MEQIGVIIQQGPQHWAIIQQEKGFGSIALSGVWAGMADRVINHAQVLARIVNEADGRIVVPWRPCKMQVEQTWEITLDGIPAGGLYRLETCLQIDNHIALEWAARGDMIHHVGVGDIWVIAGQSNAAGYGKGPIEDSPQLGIHLLRHNGVWDLASHPFNESTASIHYENREFANPGHSPFLAFGKMIQAHTGSPIGLLQTAFGGSPLKAWNPDEDGYLYRNMMKIIASAGGKVRGILWYQGCSDCNPEESSSYLVRFERMVQHIRLDLNVMDLPILTVQLNRCTDVASIEVNQSWGRVREAQRQAALILSEVYTVPALDCPLSDGIHNSPAGNMIIGERMAKVALAHIYTNTLGSAAAPNLSSVVWQVEDGIASICLQFANVSGYLIAISPTDKLFSVEDASGEIEITQWEITARNEITLRLSRSPEGESFVHGAYEMNPSSHLPLDTDTYMPMLAFYKQRARLANIDF
ncbi:sialate O-acetylesterase [Cohnella sp. WQ 127256]|uniref:sialate O-acetylesterase n=1 Tax=Cohnella sp. WQ 127256 TaxID=2938790 RepID=UPI0021185011|nr:sialate O-acetylesterase [Cohnella sp. WQ 127256]